MNLQNRIKPLVAALGVALAMAALPAGAASYCSDFSPSATPEGLTVDEMTLNGANATDCYGVVRGENINSADDLNNLNLVWGSDFELLAATENNNDPALGSFGGFDFTLSVSGIGQTSGEWLLEVTPAPGTTRFDLVGALKASNDFALYLFDDITLEPDNDGTWRISFQIDNPSPGEENPDLSHFSLFIREGEEPPTEIPEPASLGLLGLGMAGLAAMRRRRKV